jgi:hypothetical protein
MLAMAKRRGVRIAVEAAPANGPAEAWNDGGAKGIDPYSPDTAVNIIRGYNLSPRGVGGPGAPAQVLGAVLVPDFAISRPSILSTPAGVLVPEIRRANPARQR